MDIVNTENNQIFTFSLEAFTDQFRVLLNEKSPLHARYRAEYVIETLPTRVNINTPSINNTHIEVIISNSRVIFQSSPLQVDFYQDDYHALSLNTKGLMRFEHLRTKPEQ